MIKAQSALLTHRPVSSLTRYLHIRNDPFYGLASIGEEEFTDGEIHG
jgi:hypothetical protein